MHPFPGVRAAGRARNCAGRSDHRSEQTLTRTLLWTQTGWVHALLATPLALYILLDPSPAILLDPLFGYAELEGTVYAFSAGYFAYDLVVSLFFVRSHGWPFVLHAAACCFIFTAVWRPLLMGVGSTFLVVRVVVPLHRRKYTNRASAIILLCWRNSGSFPPCKSQKAVQPCTLS